MPADKQEHLVVTLPVRDPHGLIEPLRKKYPNIKFTCHVLDGLSWNHDQLPDNAFEGATMIVTLSALPSTVQAIPDIAFVQISSAGSNHLEKSPIFNDPNVAFCNSSGTHGTAIAEWVIMTMLVSSRWYNKFHDLQKGSHWADDSVRYTMTQQVSDRVGSRMGILGYGSIGRQIARLAKAMGMRVVAYTASARTTPESKKDFGYIVPGTGDPDGTYPDEWYSGKDKSSLHTFLGADLDYLVVSTPLTKATRGLIGEEEFKVLSKRQTFLFNIARGEVVNTEALVKALEAFEHSGGQEGIRGAAVDVTDPEPLPKEHPLWKAPNVIITPHVSGVNSAYLPRCIEILDINIGRHLEGKKLMNQIDKGKGYSSQASIL